MAQGASLWTLVCMASEGACFSRPSLTGIARTSRNRAASLGNSVAMCVPRLPSWLTRVPAGSTSSLQARLVIALVTRPRHCRLRDQSLGLPQEFAT
jgi:hypothetical protein